MRLSQARFQQKQLQEKEQKLLQIYDQQQQRAYHVVHRGNASSNHAISQPTVTKTSSSSHATSTSQGGKVSDSPRVETRCRNAVSRYAFLNGLMAGVSGNESFVPRSFREPRFSTPAYSISSRRYFVERFLNRFFDFFSSFRQIAKRKLKNLWIICNLA